MGAVFSYSIVEAERYISAIPFQSLMGAVFSYSRRLNGVAETMFGVSIPDGCSVQL